MIRSFSSRLTNGLAWLGILLLSSCATYHPVPLPVAPDLTRAPSLTAPASDFWLSGLKPHPFPKEGLDETSIITLAVFDDPQLKAARLQAGVAGAQLLEAGLLPDPQVTADYARSAAAYGGDIALSEDIQALRTRGAAKAAARWNQKQVHLNILWQEWQVAERARELFIQARTDSALERILSTTRNTLASHYYVEEVALQRGDVTLSTAAAALTSLTNAQNGLRLVQLNASLTRHELYSLLGLRPGVHLRLSGPVDDPPPSQAQFRAALAALPRRRADLLALRAGYESQEQRVREAILAQFPALSAGVTQSRDPVESVDYFGPSVTLTLPLFNRNRGQIAIQRATQAVLYQTYEARLDQAVGNADQVWKETHILQAQLRDLDARLPVLQQTAMAAEQNLRRYHLNAGLYVTAESSYLATQAEAIRVGASLADAQSALRTVLGLPFGSQ
jgi:cobalt-zinc-cadmium efflux system outer membrane protein